MNLSGVTLNGVNLKSILFNYVYNFNSGNYTQATSSYNSYDLGILPGWSYSRSGDSGLTNTYVLQSPNLLTNSIPNSGNGWASNYSLNQITNTNVAYAPDGTFTASHFGDNYGGGGFYAAATSVDSSFANNNWAISGYFKYCSEVTYIGVYIKDSFYGSNQFGCIINIQNGQITSPVGVSGNGTFISAFVDTLPNGWFRLKLIGSFSAAYAPTIVLTLLSDATGTGWSGGSGGGCYVWGFQAEQGSTVNTYIPTNGTVAPPLATFPATATNILQHSTPNASNSWSVYSGSPTITSGQIDPIGGTNAVLVALSAASRGTNVWTSPSDSSTYSGTTYTYSVYLKTSSGTASIALAYGAYGVSGFDPLYGPDILVTSTWQRFTVNFIPPINNSITYVGITNGSGGAAATVYMAFAQLETGTIATTFKPTTGSTASASFPRVTNLGLYEENSTTNVLLWSQDFTNASWVKFNATMASTAVLAPDGSSTAQTLTNAASTSNTQCAIYQTPSKSSGTSYTFSVFVKSGNTNRITISQQYGTSSYADNIFDVSSQTWILVASATSFKSAIALANGWWRISVTMTTTAAGNFQTGVGVVDSIGASPAASQPGNYCYVWGFQCETGNSPTSYTRTSTATVTRGSETITQTYGSVPNNIAVTSTPLGTMNYPFPSVTNLLPASSLSNVYQGYNVGSPQLTSSVSTQVMPDGSTSGGTDLVLASGYPPGFCFYGGFYNYNVILSAATTYTVSVWAKTTSGTCQFQFDYWDGTQQRFSANQTVTTTWQRFTWTYTTVSPSGTQHTPLGITFNSSQTAASFTVWGWQVEKSNVANGYIPTTSSSATLSVNSPFTLSQAPFLNQTINSLYIS